MSSSSGPEPGAPGPGRGGADDLFEQAPCGYLVADGDLVVRRVNRELCRLAGRDAEEMVDRVELGQLLSVGGRIFLGTHLLPMLEHNGAVREIALDVQQPDRTRVPVLVNAERSVLADGSVQVRVVLIESRDRRRYESDLLQAKRAAEDARAASDALASTLQRTLIPPTPPQVPHLDIAAAYRPAGRGSEVGGDFYDVFQVGGRRWVVALGDVSGKGVEAATLTSFVRYGVRTLAMRHDDPAELLTHLDVALRTELGDHFCTAVVACLDYRDGGWTMRLSLAGHPPPLLRRPDGSVTELGRYGTALGLVDAPVFHTDRYELGDGMVTLYTDGVTEARGPDGLLGEERLAGLVSTARHAAGDITDRVVRGALDHQSGDAADDIAVVTFGALL